MEPPNIDKEITNEYFVEVTKALNAAIGAKWEALNALDDYKKIVKLDNIVFERLMGAKNADQRELILEDAYHNMPPYNTEIAKKVEALREAEKELRKMDITYDITAALLGVQFGYKFRHPNGS